MKSCLRYALAMAVVCGLCLISADLFAQAPVHSPIGPPVSAAGFRPSEPQGPLPLPRALAQNPLVVLGLGIEGIDFNGSNCGCLPPDTNASVGNHYIAEAVNVQFRVFDETSGTVLLDEPLSTLFGAASGGDPYVVFDELANRWYVSAFDASDSGLYIAVSNDSTPIHGFVTYDLTDVHGFPDYNKMGFNKNAIFISYNNFGTGSGGAEIVAIDKAAILGGTPTHYVSVPAFQFRAMPPAQYHGDKTGGTEWFVSTDGTDAGGTTIRVTKMTNYLSNSPVFTYTSLPVHQYQNATTADQPGGAGSVTVFPNTTTTQVHFRKGKLITAMDTAFAKDGFVYPKGVIYKINAAVTPPALLVQKTIDPGAGKAVQMVTVDLDSLGHLGYTWIESSLAEYVSMWVATNLGKAVAAPGGSFMAYGFRIGDYSSTVVDSSDGVTFVSADEYIGTDGSTDIWRTHVRKFHN